MINPDFQNSPPLILVVADKKTRRLVLRRALKKEGYHVAEAPDGQACLEACFQLKPDLVLLDANMPNMDGFTCCVQLQSLLGDDFPPVVMITALKDQASVDRAFEVGAADYITRPIHWTVLWKVGLGDRVVFNFGNLAINTMYFSSSTPLIWEGNGLEFYETS